MSGHTFQKTYYYDDSAAVTVAAAGSTTIKTINVMGRKTICFSFSVATQNLDDVSVQVKVTPNSGFIDFTPAWAALPSGGRVRECQVSDAAGAAVDADLDTTDATQSGYFRMDVEGLYEIRVQASAAVDGAVVTPRYSLQ